MIRLAVLASLVFVACGQSEEGTQAAYNPDLDPSVPAKVTTIDPNSIPEIPTPTLDATEEPAPVDPFELKKAWSVFADGIMCGLYVENGCRVSNGQIAQFSDDLFYFSVQVYESQTFEASLNTTHDTTTGFARKVDSDIVAFYLGAQTLPSDVPDFGGEVFSVYMALNVTTERAFFVYDLNNNREIDADDWQYEMTLDEETPVPINL